MENQAELRTNLALRSVIVVQIDDVVNKVHDNDRNAIKQTIVGLMLKSPEQIQKQVHKAFPRFAL